MRSNLFTTVVSWLLATSVILSVVFCLQFVFRTRELRRIQGEMARYQNTHQVLNVLINDVANYSRHDAGIIPILQSLGIKVGTNNPAPAATPKPVAK